MSSLQLQLAELNQYTYLKVCDSNDEGTSTMYQIVLA